MLITNFCLHIYIHAGAQPVDPPVPTVSPTFSPSPVINCNKTSPNGNYFGCGPLKGCNFQGNPISIATSANTAGCITLCDTTSPCKACTYDTINGQCILLQNLTSVAPSTDGENWSTYIVQTLHPLYPLIPVCPETFSPTKMPTVGAGSRQLLMSDWLPHQHHHHHHHRYHPSRRLQSYSGGCQGVTNVSTIPLAFITPNGSSTADSLAAWQALVLNISSGGSVGGYNSSNICSVNTNTTIIPQTGGPTSSPTQNSPTPLPTPGPVTIR
jgi:hypothetical protein